MYFLQLLKLLKIFPFIIDECHPSSSIGLITYMTTLVLPTVILDRDEKCISAATMCTIT